MQRSFGQRIEQEILYFRKIKQGKLGQKSE